MDHLIQNNSAGEITKAISRETTVLANRTVEYWDPQDSQHWHHSPPHHPDSFKVDNRF